MARSPKTQPEPDALSYTAADWLRYGDIAEPTTREKLVLLAIEEIIDLGPADFNAYRVCDRLGIKHPNINYNFGGRDGLIAEATWWSFQQWAETMRQAWLTASPDPRKRLSAIIQAEVDWAKRMRGMTLLVQYPLTSKGSAEQAYQKHAEEMQKLFQRNLAYLVLTIVDIRKGTVSNLDFDVDDVPRLKVATHPKELAAAAHIGLMIHGLSLWSSGHLASSNIEDPTISKLTVDVVVSSYKKLIERVAENDI